MTHMTNGERVFGNLRYLRKKLGLTLREVEEGTGLSNAIISQIETGKIMNPGFFTIKRLADAYGVSLEDVLFKREEL